MKIKTQKRKPEAVFLEIHLQLSGHFLVCLHFLFFKEKKNVKAHVQQLQIGSSWLNCDFYNLFFLSQSLIPMQFT